METITENKDKVIHVLLVDDDHNIVTVNQMVLEEMGYAVYPAHSGKEALELIKQHGDGIDVIITDYLISGMNGIELAVEAGRYMADTPVILYTGKAESIDKKQVLEAGLAKVLVKPFKMKDLDIIIGDLLKKNEEAAR